MDRVRERITDLILGFGSNRPDVQSQHPGAGNMIAGGGGGGGPPPPGYPPQGPPGQAVPPGAQGGMHYK